MRNLILLRHAQAAQVLGLHDRERPLTDQGEADAKRAGEAIRAQGLEPDLVLCSPAVRTRRTTELAFPGAEVSLEREIYEAHRDDLLEMVRRTGDEVGTLALCGHNPAIEELAGTDHQMGPGAFVVVEVDFSWVDFWVGEGSLVSRWHP